MMQTFKKLILLLLVLPLCSWANSAKSTKAQKGLPVGLTPGSTVGVAKGQLAAALRMAQEGRPEVAATSLFSLARRSDLEAERPQIKYVLGNMLMDLKLYQTAAFQFVDVIRLKNPKYSKLAIEKLSVAADFLGDDTILNYAISRVDLSDFPEKLREMIQFRLGEIKLHSGEYSSAAALFSKVGPSSSYYNQALYNKGLAELEENKTATAVATFKQLIEVRKKAPITDTNKVAAQVGLARALYQQKEWDASIEAYSQVPRDTLMWHDTVFEQSWAMMRGARFRSALSNFQTLHSAYYEDFYMPESLLLRSIVYLYICKYDEMEKVLSLFEKTYGPVNSKINGFIKSNSESQSFFSEIEKAHAIKTKSSQASLRLPYIVLRHVLDEGDVKRAFRYLNKLDLEKTRIEGSASLRSSSLGQYALRILANRSQNTKLAIGEMAKTHLLTMSSELRDLYEQAGFIRYELIAGRKESIKKKIAGKDLSAQQIDDKVDRQFYIQNGYEYYPFQGEYWLDEIGNYHYLGNQSCE